VTDFTVQVEVRNRSVSASLGPNSGSLAGGVEGPTGPAGQSVLHGTIDPGGGVGNDNDFYINITADTLFGPKTGGAWGSGVSLVGPMGANGSTLLSGSGAPAGGTGADGDFYLKTGAAPLIYGPKAAGAWGSGTALVGPAGSTGTTGPSSWTAPAAWVTGTAYTAGPPASLVTFSGESYVCLIGHTSGTFATDLGAGKWIKVAAKGTDGAGTGTVVHTGSPTAGHVAVFGVDGDHIADGGALGAASGTDILRRSDGDGRYEQSANKNVANGYAGLDSGGKISVAILPDAVLGAIEYQGTWNATTNTPAIPTAASGNKGWYYVVATAGATSISGVTDWKVGDWLVSNGSSWDKVDSSDQVNSVAGLIGTITTAALQGALGLGALAYLATLTASLISDPTNVKTTESLVVAVSDEATAITTGTGKVSFFVPYNFTLTEVFIGVGTTSSSGLVTMDVKLNGTTIFSTLPSIGSPQNTSGAGTGSVAAVISSAALSKYDKITVDITAAGTGAKAAKCYLIGHRT
jgi:hypothetical protein